MESNLTPEYIRFVDEGQNLSALVQKVIDRVQYLPGFLGDLNTLIDMYDDPFEEVSVEVPEASIEEQPEGVQIMTSATGVKLEKRLKAAYCKQS
jgi:hypothetical protein